MPRPRDDRRREQLLAAVVADCAVHGIGGRPLREIADHVGTSHRMLLHHFGSRDELLVAIVGAVEAEQLAASSATTGDPADQLTSMWTRLSEPALRPFERLFFECYARGASGEAPFDRLVPSAVTSWLADDDGDPAARRLGLALMRGLLLDLVATDDRDGTTAALHRFVELVEGQPLRPT